MAIFNEDKKTFKFLLINKRVKICKVFVNEVLTHFNKIKISLHLTSTHFIYSSEWPLCPTHRPRASLSISKTLLSPQSSKVNLSLLVLTNSLKLASKCWPKVRAPKAFSDIIIEQEALKALPHCPWKDIEAL